MKALKIITGILVFIVLGIGAGFTGFWLAQSNHNEITQETQVTQETQETQETQVTQGTQEVDPWENWQEPTTVKFEGEDILINNGQGVASQIKWVIVDDEPELVQVTGKETNMIQWTVQFEDGEFGLLVWDRCAGTWQLTKGVN
jgi:hypothetical protein